MDDKPRHQIILVPRQNYWNWVDAVRKYAITFNASVTPDPRNAIEFHAPEQVVTIVNPAGGYTSYGDILEWFSRQSGDVGLDPILAVSPEALQTILDERIQTGQPFGGSFRRPALATGGLRELRLGWPTDCSTIVQGFGAYPEIFRRWGLPGHVGVDIKAPINCNVYSCAEGAVYAVHDGVGDHPYGIRVCVRHTHGFRTIYAHLNQSLVSTGQIVKKGDLIGLAGSTGNTSGGLLHLVLRKDGATVSDETAYPFDVVDPTPYLAAPSICAHEQSFAGPWSYGRCLVGLQGRHGGLMEKPDWDVVRAARIEALKFISPSTSPVDVDHALSIAPQIFLLIGLRANISGRAMFPSEFAGSLNMMP